MTGRECERGTRGLAGLLRMTAEVLEGYFGGWGFPWRSVESKPQAGLPSLQHQSWKGTQITSSSEKQQGFCRLGHMVGDANSLLKGQHIKFHLQTLTLDCGRGRAEWTGDVWGESGVGGSGVKAEGIATRIPVLGHSPYCRSHLSQAEHSPQSGISLREAVAPPTGITLPHPLVFKPGCWSQLEAIAVISLTTEAENKKKQSNWEDKETDHKWKNQSIVQKKN